MFFAVADRLHVRGFLAFGKKQKRTASCILQILTNMQPGFGAIILCALIAAILRTYATPNRESTINYYKSE